LARALGDKIIRNKLFSWRIPAHAKTGRTGRPFLRADGAAVRGDFSDLESQAASPPGAPARSSIQGRRTAVAGSQVRIPFKPGRAEAERLPARLG